MDQIRIKDLEVYCHHGIKKEENILGQKFLVSAIFYTNIKEAGMKDDIKSSIDYSQVAYFIKEYMKEHTYRLIESVAEHLSTELLLAFPLIQKICLTVKKPWAPILLPLDTVSVKIERGWHKCYLGIGSNIGDKENHSRQCVTGGSKNKSDSVFRTDGNKTIRRCGTG